MKTIWQGLVCLLFVATCSCAQLTDYSPYDAKISHHNINIENITRLTDQVLSTDTLRFAVISDTHTNYSDLKDAVRFINTLENVAFTVISGDITDWGLAAEFKDYYQLISKLNMPFITLIGNHDYLSNGELIYTRMFGPTSFYFDLGDYRMVVFDNVVWEKGNKEPDFNWLQKTLQDTADRTNITFMHIHPWDPQLDNGYADHIGQIIESQPVAISFFGHGHGYKYEIKNDRQYLLVPTVQRRVMAKVTLVDQQASFEMLHF